jgi:hypothetical protein
MAPEASEPKINHEVHVIQAALKTPRVAALAGIVFSLIFIFILVILRISIPADPHDAGVWLPLHWKRVSLAVNLMPVAGIAFLWFIGVIRDRIGNNEDRFFSTVFFGSGLLLIAMLFSASAIAGAVIVFYGEAPGRLLESELYPICRLISHHFMNIYGIKMSAVFMCMTSTLALRTGITPRWMALLGFPLALLLLFFSGAYHWFPLIFPVWVLIISIYVLISNLARPGIIETIPRGAGEAKE